MIRFSDMPGGSFPGKHLRKCLAVVPAGWRVPILQGPLRGTRWIVGAQTHGMWLGSYEADKQLAIAKMLLPGQVFYDIGANAGFFSLLAAKKVGENGKVIAVEPLPRNVVFIKEHARINRFTNIVISEMALSDYDGIGRFSVEGESTSRISEDGELEVRVGTLDALIEKTGAIPDVVKVDIEGAEMKMMRGAGKMLNMYRPKIFMAVHSSDIFRELSRALPPYGYSIRHLDNTELKEDVCSEVLLVPGD